VSATVKESVPAALFRGIGNRHRNGVLTESDQRSSAGLWIMTSALAGVQLSAATILERRWERRPGNWHQSKRPPTPGPLI